MQCFTAIDELNPKIDVWHQFTRVPFRLLYRVRTFTFTSASMGEGYALLIEEERHPLGPHLMTTAVIFTVMIIQGLCTRKLEVHGLQLLSEALNWYYALWAIYCLVSPRFSLKSTLLITVARILNFFIFSL